MQVNYKYAGPSRCTREEGNTVLGLCADLNRDEAVSFRGKLKQPLVFRDAMLMLREIVVADTRKKQKDRTEFYEWLSQEIDRRLLTHEKYLPGVREQLQKDMDLVSGELADKEDEIKQLILAHRGLQSKLDSYDAWKDYYGLERKFWSYIRNRDQSLWFVLDPVITVHPDQVSFEAFSQDESVYGCLSVKTEGFEMVSPPKLGTTNIDFSAKLAKEMERFRSYNEVELAVNPEGFTVESGEAPAYVEKKIDLPESWVKGFCQVSSAANLSGVSVDLAPVDIYDICAFLRRHKENKSPRYMKWILIKDEPVRIIFEPFGSELVLNAVYKGEKNREEKIWGRRRWLIAEKLLPLAESFTVKLLGFGMPQFIIADMAPMRMTIGFSSWSANDWVKGTAFNIMSGFIGDGNYKDVYELLKQNRSMTVEAICREFSATPKTKVIAGIGGLLKRGEGYFDAASQQVRFRRLSSEPLPPALYETTKTELAVQKLLEKGLENFSVRMSPMGEHIFNNSYDSDVRTELAIDADGQISALKCSCTAFNRGPRNISAPCPHILALYMASIKFTKLVLEPDKVYKTNDIMEMLL